MRADVAFTAGVGRHGPVGHDHAGTAAGGELADDVLDPGVVCVARRRGSVAPARVIFPARPGLDIERRVAEGVFHLDVRVQVDGERVAPDAGEVAVETVDGEVHPGQAPGAFVELLAVDRDRGLVLLVRGEKLLGLDEHAPGPARRVVDAAVGGLENFNEGAHDARRGEELAAPFALGASELLEEVLVDLPEQVPRLGDTVTGEPGAVEQVDELAQATLVDVVAVVDPRQGALQRRVRAHEQVHRLVDELADVLVRLPPLGGQALGVLGQVAPAGGRSNPEDVGTGVLVDVIELRSDLVLGPAVGGQLVVDLGAALLEGVGDVLEEDQAEDDVLVLGGVHRPAQLVSGLPQGVLEFLHGRRHRGVDLLLRWHVSVLLVVARRWWTRLQLLQDVGGPVVRVSPR